jgi:hypothetical protein
MEIAPGRHHRQQWFIRHSFKSQMKATGQKPIATKNIDHTRYAGVHRGHGETVNGNTFHFVSMKLLQDQPLNACKVEHPM